jgi:hypothetical protein
VETTIVDIVTYPTPQVTTADIVTSDGWQQLGPQELGWLPSSGGATETMALMAPKHPTWTKSIRMKSPAVAVGEADSLR